ncbi:PTS glucitol/sorbitol transporter subunit IIC [Anaerococcus sp. AGMB00486]|uniref:PTS glucitol/sorbitol transporter subunit IIC n=2 Tax=Anaerococcus TaxID=165779 RepID=A0ABX2NAA4_9FIRM|nr:MULTISPECIES: PTS glucitol/sorbitol transporter subunit IIC [Anaerococcus]MSS77734.1 PTS sorbitol transporter subunit IIC [Anaerococcus porci]NVF11589.1 PTS glucitol/sorbitol transporter subunit IIC [Anaerococcus faecalis]
MDFLTKLAEGFIGIFKAGGESFMGFVTGIIPLIICLMTFVTALIKIAGEEKVDKFMQKITSNLVLRYTVFPVIAVFVLANPMCYTFIRFVKEKYKPAVYDAMVSFVHPITGLFPHANGGELFVYLGIAEGFRQLNISQASLAVRYFIAGIIVILIRGIVTQKLTEIMANKQNVDLDALDEVK